MRDEWEAEFRTAILGATNRAGAALVQLFFFCASNHSTEPG
jgi:hypothetical protein